MIGLPPRDQSLQDERFEAFQLAIARRYRIERELGHGGMATVYLTQDLKHGRAVALKLLRPEIAAVLGIDRFLREIQVSARLSHPNILPFYDSDEAAGLLFYVMPYVESGTLHDRLQRGPRPNVAEALDLTRQVAAGLAYAHEEGVIHRDIKPANLLIASGHVFISDFGIARMVRQAVTTEGMTEAGFAIGTPDYMAPEQSRGTSQVDGRADEYSLAAVLFEMLVGQPPSHTGGTAAKVRRGLRAARPDLPSVIETALIRALSNDSDARFKTVAEFAAALEGAMAPVEVRRRQSTALRAAILTAGVAALGISAWQAVKHFEEKKTDVAVQADTTRYVIFPFEDPSGAGASLDESDRLHDALMRWSGLSVIDPRDVAEQIAKLGARHPSSAEAADIAGRLNAGRYIRGEVSRLGDSLRLHATIYDVNAGQLKDYTVRIPPDLSGAESRFATLTDQLLFRGLGAGAVTLTGSRSLPALQVFGRGQAAIFDWNLAAADSAFSESVGFDRQFAKGNLWLALVRDWRGVPTPLWSFAAEAASSHPEDLSPREREMADALRYAGRRDFAHACPRWRALARQQRTDFIAWFGTGHCESNDDAVVPDLRSASRWRFRSSSHSALQAYRRAFQLLPAMLGAFRGDAYESARRLLFTRATQLRLGHALAPDTTTFIAVPAWEGDSLAMVPYASPSERRSASHLEALHHQRLMFRELTQTWATAVPRSVDARVALAIALEMLGEPAALDTIRTARGLAANDPERVRVASTEAWMRVRLALPAKQEGLLSARALADSLLRQYGTIGDAPEPSLLASLAMLTGRPALAARLLRRAVRSEGLDVEGGVATSGIALLAFSAAGGPVDSIVALETEVSGAIERSIPSAGRASARLEWLGRPLTLAFPAVKLTSLATLLRQGDYLVDAFGSYERADTAAVLKTLQARIDLMRQQIDPASRTFDTLYPIAWLLAALGRKDQAIASLDPTLSVVGEVTALGLEQSVQAASMVRAMALRAELADQARDHESARLWARAVVALWQGGEALMQPLVQRMEHLSH